MSLKDAALQYAAYGWAVLPVQPGGKAPAVRNGVKDATTDPEKVAAWWDDNPDYNIGIATGRVSGIAVIDVDSIEWEPGDEDTPDIPDTAVVSTPRGHHFYFECREDGFPNSVGKLAHKVDTRGDGGYVLAPPSVNGNGWTYEWADKRKPAPMPEWVAETLRQRKDSDTPLAVMVPMGRPLTAARY